MSGRADAPLVVVGDALLDRDLEGTVERLSPEAPVPVVDDPVERARPGGAGLAAALAAADRERPVRLVTALADDEPAAELRALLADAGVETIDLGLGGATPEKVRVRGGGRTLLRLDRGGRGEVAVERRADALVEARAAIAEAAGVLVSDYGRGVAALDGLREALAALPPHRPLVWDPHPRGAEPVPGALLVTPNADEAEHLAPEVDAQGTRHGDAARASALARRWRAAYVCVTRGAAGALLAGADGPPLVVPVPSAAGAGDPCGAGDRFASRAAMLLAGGELPSTAVAGAVVAASEFVARGGAATHGARAGNAGACGPSASAASSSHNGLSTAGVGEEALGGGERIGEEAALALSRSVRERGGTVVATGGCFDLLHAGHVSVLRAARSLGDCLIVLLNSDASMRRLKGPDRPLVEQGDRAAVLAALDAVDAVVVFDEDTPTEALARLRPDVWAKGGDYAGRELPETAVLERHGGQSVVLPYVAGRSTTRLIEEVALRGAR
jgi:D-beta-D-heptose 7-phosphate kinase / D-beta-D-heptose 1-phosphate adenosyltransferase